MRAALPPPLVLGRSSQAPASRDALVIADASEPVRALAFGALLVGTRTARGKLYEPIELYCPGDPTAAPPDPGPGRLSIPHVYSWETRDRPALAWELCPAASVESLFDSTPTDVARWAERPDLVIRLARLAGDAADRPDGQHLSFRWLLANQEAAALALSSDVMSLEHVSLHVTAGEEEAVVRAFTRCIGMVEIPRPATIATPGRWLQAGTSRVHLNSRDERPGESGFPGTAPNHVCFAVADLDGVERALQQEGFATSRAGSLGNQVWFCLGAGTTVELQSRR